MRAIILSVGDELVLGQTVDTNSAWISRQLAAVGCEAAAHLTVPDDQKAIEGAIEESAGRCDFLIVSGGIGPTEDDLTRQALAAVLGVDLVANETWLERLESFFRSIGRPMSPLNRVQAMIPRGAAMIENTAGTAAGIDARISRGAGRPELRRVPVTPGPAAGQVDGPAGVPVAELTGRPIGRVLTKMGKVSREQVIEGLEAQKRGGGGLFGQILIQLGYVNESDVLIARAAQQGIVLGGAAPAEIQGQAPDARPAGRASDPSADDPACRIFVMPGVPKEMKAMFGRDVLPHVRAASGGAVILSRTLHTFGLGESAVAELLGPLMDRGRNPSVGTTVSGGIVSLRVNARFPSAGEAARHLEETAAACRAALGELVFGQDDETLQGVVGGMLKDAGKTVTTAESCTGGLLAKMLTDVPGSSAYFKQGWVVYSNDAKASLLGVAVSEEGAVSERTVVQLAGGACDAAGADYALAVSGIAGPGGGTPTKPVGTVCIGIAHNHHRQSEAPTGSPPGRTSTPARSFSPGTAKWSATGRPRWR